MKRSRMATIAAGVQLVYGVCTVGTALYLLWLTRTADIRNSGDPAAVIHGLFIAAAIILPPGLLVLVSGIAMWKSKLWGWWLATVTDSGLMLVFVYSLINDGWKRADSEDITFTVVSVIPVILLLVPAVRKAYWHKRAPDTEAVSTSE